MKRIQSVYTQVCSMHRVNALCSICGERSQKKYSDKKSFLCINFEHLIHKCYEINIQEYKDLMHSKTMCRSCYSRMKRIDSETCVSEETTQNAACDIASSQHIWTMFAPNTSVEECVTCVHFMQLGKGGRLRMGRNDHFDPRNVTSHNTDTNNSTNKGDGGIQVFIPPTSTPSKTPCKVDA